MAFGNVSISTKMRKSEIQTSEVNDLLEMEEIFVYYVISIACALTKGAVREPS